MSRCGCNNKCNCLVDGDGTTTTVTGTGTADDPYIVSAPGGGGGGGGGVLNVEDTTTLDLSLTGTGTPLDPYVLRGDVTTPSSHAVTYDAAQGLSDTQKSNARANIGAESLGYVILPKPTGVATTDDAALSAAITAAGTSGVIHALPGTYAISTHHVLTNGIDLQGMGGGSTSHIGVTVFKCTTAVSQIEVAAGGGTTGGFRIDGNLVATTPFRRSGGTDANARSFQGIVVLNNAVSGTHANDLCQFYGAQNDLWYQCGFGGADRDIAVFDQGYGGAQFIRCEWIVAGRYHHRFDNLVSGGQYPSPTDLAFTKGIFEGGGGESIVKVNIGKMISYSDYTFYTSNVLTGASVDVVAGDGIELRNPLFQSTPATLTAGTHAVHVAGTSTIVLTGRAWYLNFAAALAPDGTACYIYDSSDASFYNCTASFIGLNGALATQVASFVTGSRQSAKVATDQIELNYNIDRTAYLSSRTADGTLAFYSGSGFSMPDVNFGRRQAGAVGTTGTQVICTGQGTAGQRPVAAVAITGATYLNKDTGNLEWCDGTTWHAPASALPAANLPAYAPSGAANVWDAELSRYNIKGSSMHARRAKYASAAANLTSLHLGYAGDSTLIGYNGASYDYKQSIPVRHAQAVGRLLGHPYPTMGVHLAVGANTVLGDRWVLTGSWTVSNCIFNTTANATCTWTMPDQGTAMQIFYSSSASFTYKVDGEATARTAPAGTLGVISTLTITTLQNGTALTNAFHTIVCTLPTVNTVILGQRGYNPHINQIHVHNVGLGGATAASGSPENWSATTNSPLGLGFLGPGIITAAGVTLDEMLISIGDNDLFAGGETTAQIKAGIVAMIGYWPTASKTLLHEMPISGTDNGAFMSLAAEFFNLADVNDIPLLDWNNMVNGVASYLADGLAGADNVHPTWPHQAQVGAWIADSLVGYRYGCERNFPGVLGLSGGRYKVIESAGVYPPRPNVPAGFVDYEGADQPVDWLDGDSWDDMP